MAYTLPKNALDKAIELQGGPKNPNISSVDKSSLNASMGIMPGQNMSVAPTKNMSVAPKVVSTPITTANTGIPNVGIPGVKGLNTPIAPSASKNIPDVTFSPERAAATNAVIKSIQDTQNLAGRIKNDDPRVIELRKHFDYLKEKGELQLDKTQSEYIKRFKTKFPEYNAVPDAILYGKVILADPKTMDKYGNIGEKSFGKKLLELPGNIISSTGDIILDTADTYKKRMQAVEGNALDKKSLALGGLTPNQAIIGGGTVLEGAATGALDIVGHILNLKAPANENETKTTEYLANQISEIVTPIKDFSLPKLKTATDTVFGLGTSKLVVDAVANTIKENPKIGAYFGSALGWTNLLGLGAGAKIIGKEGAEQLVKEVVAKGPAKWLGRDVSQGIMDVGIARSVANDLAVTYDSWIVQQTAKLATDIPTSASGASTLTRKIPEKTVANFLALTPTERRNVEKILWGKTAEQYILEKNLGGKSKGELTDIFYKQANDSYNGIKEKLAPITERYSSEGAKMAIDDMVETFDGLSALEKQVYAKDIAYLQKLAEQTDFTLSELHAIRQAFDKVNTGMYTAKGEVRSGTRAIAEVDVRNKLSTDIQENALKHGIDVKEMNEELRVALTMKDGLLRSLSQETKNNLVGLQDLGIMGIFSKGDPLTAVGLGIGKKWLEGKMPAAAQKLFNLNKTPYEKSAVMRGNTVSTGGKSRLFGLSDNMGGDSTVGVQGLDDTVKTTTIPTNISKGESLAIGVEQGTSPANDTKSIIKALDELATEEKAKAIEKSEKIQKIDKAQQTVKEWKTEIDDIATEREIAMAKEKIAKDIKDGKYTREELVMIAEVDKSLTKLIQEVRNMADNTETGKMPVVEEKGTTKTAPDEPKMNSAIETKPEPQTTQTGASGFKGKTRDEKKAIITEVFDSITGENGGITLNFKEGAIGPRPYVSISPFPARSKIIPTGEFTKKDIAAYIRENIDLLEKNDFSLGGWKDTENGLIYLDVSVLLPKTDMPFIKKFGKQLDQKAIFDLEEFKDIPTGGKGIKSTLSEENVLQILKDKYNIQYDQTKPTTTTRPTGDTNNDSGGVIGTSGPTGGNSGGGTTAGAVKKTKSKKALSSKK